MKKYELRMTMYEGDELAMMESVKTLSVEFFDGVGPSQSSLKITVADAATGLNAPIEFPKGTYDEVKKMMEEIMRACDPVKVNRLLQKVMGFIMIFK